LLRELRRSNVFSEEISYYDRLASDHPDKNYAYLMRRLRSHIELKRLNWYREEMTKSLTGGIASPAGKDGKGKNKGDGKGGKSKGNGNLRTRAAHLEVTRDNAQAARTRKMSAEISSMESARPASLAPDIIHLLAVSSESREVVARGKTACSRMSTLTSHLLPGLAQPQRQLTARRVTRTQELSKDVDAAVATAVEDAERARHASRPLEQPPSFCRLQYRRRKGNRRSSPHLAVTLDLRMATSDRSFCASARMSTSSTLLSGRKWCLLALCTGTGSTFTRTRSGTQLPRVP